MTKKPKKRKPKKPVLEDYEFEIDDWEVLYSFRGQTKDDHTNPDRYSESAQLTIFGKPVQPIYKDVSVVQMYLWSDPKLEDHWKDKPFVEAYPTVGHMTVLTDKITLDVNCHIPPRLFSNIKASLGHDKMKYVQVYGEKLRWGRGFIFRISLSTTREE